MKKSILFLCVLMVLCFPFSHSHAATVDVSIIDNQFVPSTLTINVGDTVRWTNDGPSVHTTTSTNQTSDPKWDSGNMTVNQQFPFTFTQPGIFPYLCTIHGFTGTIVVGMPLPSVRQGFSYPPIVSPVLNTNPAQAMPIGLGTIATGGDTLSIFAALSQVSGPVDLYFLVIIPAVDPVNIYLMKSDNSFQPVSVGLSPWKTGITVLNTERVIADIPKAALPAGPYIFELLVVPAGDQSLTKFFAWATILII